MQKQLKSDKVIAWLINSDKWDCSSTLLTASIRTCNWQNLFSIRNNPFENKVRRYMRNMLFASYSITCIMKYLIYSARVEWWLILPRAQVASLKPVRKFLDSKSRNSKNTSSANLSVLVHFNNFISAVYPNRTAETILAQPYTGSAKWLDVYFYR